MTKLSDTQLLVLSAAAQRDDRNVLPLPGSLRGGAATKVVGALISRGLVAERVTDSVVKADPALNRIWRNDEEGRAVLLQITDEGLAALGIEPDSMPDAAGEAEPAPTAADATEAPDAAPAPATAPAARKVRTGTKQAELIAMLERPEGATIAEVVAATGWQPHTVRGAIAGALKKKLGLNVVSEKVEERGRVYRITA